jgi:hypothetical protein
MESVPTDKKATATDQIESKNLSNHSTTIK